MTGVEAISAFAGDPQPVEVFHRGVWYSGELLAWRHELGRVRARVRCRVNGLRHSAWVDLADLRLPGTPSTHDTPAPVAATTGPPPVPPPAPPRPTPTRDLALDDETQPHVLLPGRRARTKPAAARLPPPRYPRPSEQLDARRSAAV